MHPSLRQKHKMIWLIWAIVIPLLFIAAIMVIPKKVKQEKLYQAPVPKTSFHPLPEQVNLL